MGGAALLIDYGHVRSGPGDTFQAIRGHGFRDTLDRPGECDLTGHVDFEALAAAVEKGGAKTYGPLTQGRFLFAMGLSERAGILKRHADETGRAEIDAAVDRLAGQVQMGHLFKVIAATQPDMTPPFPFQQSSS
jgi:SAM-dependent MidA family methyltransferase